MLEKSKWRNSSSLPELRAGCRQHPLLGDTSEAQASHRIVSSSFALGMQSSSCCTPRHNKHDPPRRARERQVLCSGVDGSNSPIEEVFANTISRRAPSCARRGNFEAQMRLASQRRPDCERSMRFHFYKLFLLVSLQPANGLHSINMSRALLVTGLKRNFTRQGH